MCRFRYDYWYNIGCDLFKRYVLNVSAGSDAQHLKNAANKLHNTVRTCLSRVASKNIEFINDRTVKAVLILDNIITWIQPSSYDFIESCF